VGRGRKSFSAQNDSAGAKKIENTRELACSVPFARFAHLAIAWLDAVLSDIWTGASTKRSFQQDAAGFSVALHNPCGTRLWTTCTRLILRQIQELVFY
jgi:hypothetical protein